MANPAWSAYDINLVNQRMEGGFNMHFITGGAFNGKKTWVKNHYKLETLEYLWLSAYKNDSLVKTADSKHPPIVILEGMEKWISNNVTSNKTTASILIELQDRLNSWIKWEKQSEQHRLLIIGTDISKEIVPTEQQDRHWQVIHRWMYQYKPNQSSHMDVIWYRINQRIK